MGNEKSIENYDELHKHAMDILEKMWPLIAEYENEAIPALAGTISALLIIHIGENLENQSQRNGYLQATLKIIEMLYKEQYNLNESSSQNKAGKN